MSNLILYTSDDPRAKLSVVNQQLTTAATGRQRSAVKNSLIVQEMFLWLD
jgi:hypothetical protein